MYERYVIFFGPVLEKLVVWQRRRGREEGKAYSHGKYGKWSGSR